MPLARLIPIMLLKLLCFRVTLQDFVCYAPYTYTYTINIMPMNLTFPFSNKPSYLNDKIVSS